MSSKCGVLEYGPTLLGRGREQLQVRQGADWVGRTEAEAEVVASRERFLKNPHAIDHSGDPGALKD